MGKGKKEKEKYVEWDVGPSSWMYMLYNVKYMTLVGSGRHTSQPKGPISY